MGRVKTDLTIDAKGLACPMPILRTRMAINEINPGEVLEVQATDKGSKADIQAWSKSSGHHYLGTVEENGVLTHYIRKASKDEETVETEYPHVVTNEELAAKLESNEEVLIVDVREPAEFAFGHIPSAVSMPLGELEERAAELGGNHTIYVICRTGNRSDAASRILSEKGIANVWNVKPGMSLWNGPVEGEN
ncbi:sulfurtransferase TusA family protein [Mesobacillus zeae]|uniref:Rhodanese domain-containing protein n=1 Tax=Mesobacillus zeae TaxID=1917180 RepID=A0A398BM32_9BACI|nr:sulfurtransferase TusA family protein [Mesobacillus zeae]RID88830.1 hypothetical protein D1970_00870 [Mesobacillus zeae]